MSAINAIAAATFTPDEAALEAARVEVSLAAQNQLKADQRWAATAPFVRRVWPLEAQCDVSIVRGWVIEGVDPSGMLAKPRAEFKGDELVMRDRLQTKVANYTPRVIEYAYREERAAAVKAAAERKAREAEANRSPEEKDAAEAKAEAAEATKASVQASYEVGKASADVKVAKAEAKALSEKVKAVKAAAKLDPTKAAEAAEAEAEAAAKAEEAKLAEAKLAEAAAKANDAKAVEEAKRKEAAEKAESIRLAKAVEKTVETLRALILKAGEECKGAEGLYDLTMALAHATDLFENANA